MMKAMRHLSVLLFALLALVACKKQAGGVISGVPFDASKPITITSFKPDSGGIATQMIIEGENFGNDTVGLSVYFVDSLGVKHKGGLVSANGTHIYLTVPKLTYLRQLDVVVERQEGGKTYEGVADNMPFLYKTEIAVATIIGQPSTNNQLPTVGGSFASATLSAPAFLTLDDEDNIFITERPLDAGIFARNDKGQLTPGNQWGGNILMADTKNQELMVLKYHSYEPCNAPTFSDEEGEEAIYIPEDRAAGYLRLRKGANYAIQRQAMLFSSSDDSKILDGNWKHAMLINKEDKMLYTILWKGQLVRINPKTRQSEVLINKVVPDIPNVVGSQGSDVFYIFSPIEPMVMYASLGSYNMIKRIDLNKVVPGDPDAYRGENYAGLAITDGPQGGRGWEDGPLKSAKFNDPKQLSFTSDGKLYIADALNHCVRVIDTTVPAERAVVNTAVGIPGSPGFRDGGPDQALFNRPSGVAVSSDGSELYVADHLNHVIRKLAIQ